MTRTKDREKAVKLRLQGKSYSNIKAELGISKSTLSGWLKSMPLSPERIKELQGNSEIRIEKSRETKRKKKEKRRQEVYEKVSDDIEKSNNTQFVAGFYLYWGEGTKTAEYIVALTNTDPSIVRCFVEWLYLLGVSPACLRIKIHMYSDQNEATLKEFWSGITNIPIKNFYKTYKKDTSSVRKTYKGMFSFGTCSVIYGDRDVYEYVLEGIKYLRTKYSK